MAVMRRILPGLLLATLATAVYAQSYPAKPIRMVVPWPPGARTTYWGAKTRGVESYDAAIMYAIWAPAKTPAEIIGQLHGAIVKVLHSPEFKLRLEREGASDPIGNTPGEVAATIRADMPKLTKLARAAGLQPQ